MTVFTSENNLSFGVERRFRHRIKIHHLSLATVGDGMQRFALRLNSSHTLHMRRRSIRQRNNRIVGVHLDDAHRTIRIRNRMQHRRRILCWNLNDTITSKPQANRFQRE